ncbi:condensin-2 complex subunit D3-L-like isoform X2 [Oratosquilla oratoria]|uniref:condensin-2 complex subunit D3-L-like isoform X2 n=1 Tax=Oratosquilla oratoria TaxID=337810 RepID=UPI003F7706D0
MAASEDGAAEQVIELFAKYGVDRLDKTWVGNVIDSDFTEVEEIPSSFEEIHCSTNFNGLFRATLGALRQLVDIIPAPNSDENDRNPSLNTSNADNNVENDQVSRYSKFWVNLSENTNTKSLLALLFFYIHRGQRYDAKEEAREVGIQASSLYFLLLCVPGSSAFRLFHPVLYLKALDVMRLTTKLNVSANSPKKRPSSSQRGSQRPSHDVGDRDQDDDDEVEMAMLSAQEANRFIRSLNILLHDFIRLLQRFSLKRSPETLDETVGILVDVTRSETHNAQGIFVGRHGPGSVTALAYNAYVSLQNVCSRLHGNPKKIVTLVMKHIIVNILMVGRGSSQMSWRSLGVIREHSLIFVKYLLTQLKEVTYDSVYILVQHLCVRVPDKADFRSKTSQSVVEILKFLPIKLYTRLVKWLFRFSHNEKAGHRLFVLEVISKMLCEEERNNEGEGSIHVPPTPLVDQSSGMSFDNVTIDHQVISPNQNYLSHKFLLSIIFSRCRDSAATVRSKALTLLAECTLSANPTIMCAMKDIFFQAKAQVFTTPHIPDNNINCESPLEIQDETGDADKLDLPNAGMVMSMLRRRALDDKVTVRKSALQVMENLMRLDNGMLSVKNLKVLAAHCRDPALLVRKQMITSLTFLMDTYPEHDDIATIWVTGVLPLVLDPEVKVQEKVVEVLDQLLFSRLTPYHKYQPTSAAQQLPWRILETITKETFHKFFKKGVMLWTKSELVRQNIMKMVYTHVGHENNESAWMLLGIMSHHLPIRDTSFILDYYEQHMKDGVEVGMHTMQQVFYVLCNSIKYVPGERLLPLQEDLIDVIAHFKVEAELISPIVDVITLLSYAMDGDDENGYCTPPHMDMLREDAQLAYAGQKAIVGWAGPILKSCDEYLKQVLFATKQTVVTETLEEKMFRYLYTMGEMAMLCPSKVNRRMFLSLQSIIFHQSCSYYGCEKDSEGSDVMPSSQTQCSQPQSIAFTPTPRLQALSIVTLGKMCLQHEDQAKKIIPALGKMLDTNNNPAIKTNIIFLLSDMCVRYATLVDPLMPQIAVCLRDPNIQVRRTTLTLLINLLQEDYLKLKGSFFYRILQCLTDEQEDIRDTVVFYITERLLKRFPKILCQHFIECIFHYNCYEEHESYNRFRQSKQEKDLFSLAGAQFKEERMNLYRFMLDHMPDDQRFTTTQRLCQDVLGGVVDGRIQLTPASLPMLEDTLMVLSSDEIKLATLKARTEDVDQATDEAEQAAMAGMAIKKTIISQVVKRNVIENIVPILMALKHKLEEHRSPLMRHLLLYLKELMKDYKNEVKEILAGDKQLAKEIEFDLRRLDKEEERLAAEEERRLAEEHYLTEEAERNPGADAQQNLEPTGFASPVHNNNVPVGSPAHSSPVAVCPRTPAGLLKQAMINSKHLSERRKSIAPDNNQRIANNEVAADVDMSPADNSYGACTNMPLAGNTGVADVDMPPADDAVEANGDLPSDPAPPTGELARKPAAVEEGDESSAKAPPPEEPLESPSKSSSELSEAETNSESVRTENEDDSCVNENLVQYRDPRPNPEDSVNSEIHERPRVSEKFRAISTPHKTLGNITFMNQTQELSSININTSMQSAYVERIEKIAAIPLEWKNLDVLSKDEEFSMLRRASKDKLEGSKPKDSKSKQDCKSKSNRPSGGLFESYSADSVSDVEGDSTMASVLASEQARSDSRAKNKRTRDMASLSPDTNGRTLEEKNKEEPVTKSPPQAKPDTKRTRRRKML